MTSSHAPVNYFDESHRAAKRSRLNPHAKSSKETLEIMAPHFNEIGLSRLIDLTGQDRIGLPVFNAVKPGMVNYSVQHGKGITKEDARLSAVMETFERHFGSNADLPSFSATYDQASRDHTMIPFERLAVAKAGIFRRDTVIEWTIGFDIAGQAPVAVPLDLALLRPHAACRKLPQLQASSNGLASATTFAEAVCQGLMEVLERDAITLDVHKSMAHDQVLPLDQINWRSIDHPVIGPLFQQIHGADIIPLLFSCTADTGIPTYNCFIADRRKPNEGFFHGMGTGMDEATAIVRASTEAVQARSALRAGTRDIFFHTDAWFHDLSDPMTAVAQCGGEEGGRNLNDFIDLGTDSFEADIHRCIEKLAEVGMNQVIVLRLTPPEADFEVVRVMVPGLEGYILPLYSPGKRALAMIKEENR